MTTEAPQALAADACPDPELLAAYIDGGVTAAERTSIEAHLVDCGDCRDIVGDSVAFEAPTPVVPFRRRHRGILLVVAGGFLAAASVVLMVRLQRPSPYYIPEVADLVRAVGEDRPVEPRITGGFAYGVAPTPLRGEASPRPPLKVISAAAAIEERAKQQVPGSQAALGVAQLIMGESGAVKTLEDAAAQEPDDPRIKSDLAAAYLVAGRRTDDARLLARALEAAEAAVAAAPGSVEALFNRALALESLGLVERARAAWDAFLKVDDRSKWADEARQHRASLAAPSRSSLDLFKRRLGEAVDEQKTPALVSLIASDTFQTREYVEGDILAAWAEAIALKHATEAQRLLQKGLQIATDLQTVTHDRFTRDVVAHAMGVADTDMLARGITAYEQGRHELDEFRTALAEESLVQAETWLTTVASPLALSARFHRTLPAYYRRQYATATATLNDLQPTADARQYAGLSGQIAWRRGLISLVEGRYADSLGDYRRALGLLEQTAEVDQIASVENAMAEGLRYVGDLDESWHYQLRAVRTIGRTWNPRRRHSVLLTMARTCLRDELPRTALAIQDELVANAIAWGEPAGLTSARLQRARSLAALDRADEADRELALARDALSQISDATFANQYRTELALATGEVATRVRPEDAIRALATADRQMTESGATLRRPQLLLVAGRANRLAGHPGPAVAAFENGIELFEARRTTLPDEELRLSFFDDAWDLFDEAVRLLIEQDRTDEALAYLERAHARVVLQVARQSDGAGPLPIADLRARLPSRTALLYYGLLPDRVCIWIVSARVNRFVQVPVKRQTVERLAQKALGEIQSVGSGSSANIDLYDLLIRPVANNIEPNDLLVIVPDGALHRVSFAALRSRASAAPLIVTNAIVTTVSGTAFVAQQPTGRPALDRVLVIGDPSFDSGEFPTLSRLPEAGREAREIAEEYPHATVLTGADATIGAFRAALPDVGSIHFAGHALANLEFPWLSRLVFAASPDGSTLFAYEVPRLALQHVSLVVLAACSTAAGTVSRSEGPLSLARPFIVAGVPTVIGTLWDVPDRPSSILLREFHRRVAAGIAPVFALQLAQTSMARSDDPILNRPATWAAFEAIGTAAGARGTEAAITTGWHKQEFR